MMEVATRMPSPTRQESFSGLVASHQSPIWRYLRFLGADETLASDLTQETFLAVWRRPFEDRGPGPARTYLRTVARNLYFLHLRRTAARPALRGLEEAEAVWERYEGDDGEAYRRALRACLELLGERQRQAVDLFYREELSREEVGCRLGVSLEGAKTLLRRARDSLRSCVRGKVRA